MQALLINPPLTDPFQIPLGMPTLAGFISRQGVTVEQRDMSLEFIDYVVEKTAKEYSREASSAKTLLKSPRFYDLRLNHLACRWLFEVLSLYLRGFGMGIGDAPELDPSFARLHISSGKDLLSLAKDIRKNPFQGFFRQRLLPDVKKQRPRLIGISVGYEWQLIPALTIASIMRADGVGIPVYIGGPYITYARDRLLRHPEILAASDAYVVFEGELPTLALLNRPQRRSFSRVPNLLYVASRSIRATEPAPPPAADKAPAPLFASSALDQCLLPEPVLPILANRSACPYGRCAFCNAAHAFIRKENPKSVERLYEEIEELHRRHGCTHFTFNDDCVPIEMLARLARMLLSENKSYHFFAALRSSETIQEKDLKLIRQAGFLRVQFGFESSSDRMLKRFSKNRSHADMVRLLHLCRRTGISVLLSAFIGFPGERQSEADATIDFFNRNNHLFDAASLVPFSLEEGSRAWNHPERYGIDIVRGSPHDLFHDLSYTTRSGISKDKVLRSLSAKPIRSRFEPVLGTAPSLLYLSRYGYAGYRKLVRSVRKEGSFLHPAWGPK
jgi:anaerobic magnesium-protoporphyrin IX monomethyl ester cyclase